MSENGHVETLISSLAEDYTPDVARHLEECGIQAINPLVAALRQPDYDPYAHDTFAEILVNILITERTPTALDVLLPLSRHTNGEVRRRVAAGLSCFPEARSEAGLRHALEDSYDAVCHTAAYALIALLYGGNEPEACTAALQDPHPHVRYIAIRSLEFMAATPQLIGALANNDASVRLIATYYLGRTRSFEAVDHLTEHLYDPSIEVRRGVVWALGQIGDNRVVKLLIPLVNADDTLLVRAVHDALHNLRYHPR